MYNCQICSASSKPNTPAIKRHVERTYRNQPITPKCPTGVVTIRHELCVCPLCAEGLDAGMPEKILARRRQPVLPVREVLVKADLTHVPIVQEKTIITKENEPLAAAETLAKLREIYDGRSMRFTPTQQGIRTETVTPPKESSPPKPQERKRAKTTQELISDVDGGQRSKGPAKKRPKKQAGGKVKS